MILFFNIVFKFFIKAFAKCSKKAVGCNYAYVINGRHNYK